MFFLYIQYYMHFYEIWCFLNSGYIWNRQQCGNISSIYVKRYLFGGTPVWKWVVLMVDPPDSGIWMVCYQEWWSEIGCCRLVVGTVRQVKRSGGLAAERCQDVLGGSTGMADVLSEGDGVGVIIIIIIWCWLGVGVMVWWGVSAVSGSSERYEIPCSLMKSHYMKSNVALDGSNGRMLSDSKRQIPRITARECRENWLMIKKNDWLCDSHGVRTHDPYIKSVMLYLLS